MKMRNAVLTGVTGVMLNMGISSVVSAQPGYRYRDYRKYSETRGYGYNDQWEARQMVREAYRGVLLREPDPSGLRAYTDMILNRGWSEADVRRALLNSPEYTQRFGSTRRGWRRYR